MERLLGTKLEMDRCEIDPLRASLVVDGFRFGEESGPLPKVSARTVRLFLGSLGFGRAVSIRRVELFEPEVSWTLPESDGDEREEPAERDACLAVFDRFQVDAIEVHGARVSVALDQGQRLLSLRDLDLEVALRRSRLLPSIARGQEGAVMGRSEIYRLDLKRLSGRYQSAGSPDLELGSLVVAAELDPKRERLEIEGIRASLPGMELEVSGAIETLCSPTLRLSTAAQVDLEEVGRLLSMEELTGSTSLQATFDGLASSPRIAGAADFQRLALDHDFTFGDLSVGFAIEDRLLLLDELVWPIEEGRARIRAEIGLEEELPAKIEVWTEGLEFHRLMTHLGTQNTPVIVTVDSSHQLSGKLGGGMLLEGQSALELRGFRVRDVPWHAQRGDVIVEIPGRATLDARTRITSQEIDILAARLGYGSGTLLELDARLSFDSKVGMSIQASAPRFDLGDVASHVAGLPLRGKGTIEARVEGPYEAPSIEGDLDFVDAQFYGAELGAIQAHVISLPHERTLDFHELAGKLRGTSYAADVQLLLESPPSMVGELVVGEGGDVRDLLRATAPLTEALAWLGQHLQGNIERFEAKVGGPLRELSGGATVRTRDAQFMERPFDTLELGLELESLTKLRIEGLEAKRGEGELVGHASFDFDLGGRSTVQAAATARRLSLRELLGAFGEWAQLEGDVEARLLIDGPFDSLDVRGEVGGTRLGAGGVSLAPTRLSLETQGDQVVIRGALARAGLLSAAVRLADALPYEAALELDIGDLARFLPESFGVGGEVRGSLSAQGTLADIPASAGAVALSTLRIVSDEFEVESAGEVRFAFDGPSFSLQRIDLRGPNTQLMLQGARHPAGELDLQAHGSFDARLVETLLPQIEYAGGVIELQAALTGRPESPLLVGSAQIRDGAFRVKILPIQVQGLQGRLAFSQNQVVVEEMRLGVNGGPATLGGSVSIGHWAPEQFDLVLEGSGMSWRMPADWPAVVSGRVLLGGSWPNDLFLGGRLTVDRLRYAKDLELEKAILDFRRRVLTPPPADDLERIHFDLDLLGGRDMRVDNNLVRARLQFVGSPGEQSGRLKLVGSNVRLGLLGSVEVVDGTAFFRGNEYRITHGMVDFSDRDRIDPTFDLTAETEVRDYRVAARAYGKLGEGTATGYQLDLRSEPMLAQADIVTLLTFGITSWDLDRGGNAALGAGVAAEALLAVSGLDEHVRRWLPENPLFMDPDLSVTSQYSELTGQMEPMAVFETRVLTERLKLKAAAPFSTAKGRRASMEVRVSDRLSTQLVWQNEVVGYSSGDLGLDLKLRWEWE